MVKKTGDNSIPSYVKVTVHSDFGKPTQTKKVTVIELNDLNKKESILKTRNLIILMNKYHIVNKSFNMVIYLFKI